MPLAGITIISVSVNRYLKIKNLNAILHSTDSRIHIWKINDDREQLLIWKTDFSFFVGHAQVKSSDSNQ